MRSLFFVAVMSVAKEAVMARLAPERSAELEAFWRSRHEGWANSSLNQRAYCEAHGLPFKRFGYWRAKFKDEVKAAQKGLLYRRGGHSHMSSHMTDRDNEMRSTGYIPSGKGLPEARRRAVSGQIGLSRGPAQNVEELQSALRSHGSHPTRTDRGLTPTMPLAGDHNRNS